MSASFKKTVIKSYPIVSDKTTTDTLYWKNFEFPITKKEFGPITHIDFSPVKPYKYAVTNSSRVQIYSCKSSQVDKTISRFREVAYSGSFRGDGKLMVAGSGEGHVKLFDIDSKSLLRVFKGHSDSCQVSHFTADNLHVVSGSDDRTVRLWDIPSEQEVIQYAEHQDYIRCGTCSQASKDIFVSGSYDHTVKLYDTRTPTSVLTVDHGQPVESVLMFPSGGVFISAGGNVIKVWDALAGGRLLTQTSNHHKTITSMCFASNYQRLLTGSLDRHVKVYDISTYQVVHTLDYPGQILAVNISLDDDVLAVGMVDGLLSVQHRKPDFVQVVKRKRKKVSYRFTLRGKTHMPSRDDHVVPHKQKEKLAKYDRFFKRFEHSKALDAALDIRVRTKTPDVTVSVLLELIRRGAIMRALAGRDERSLASLLKFLQKNIGNPRFTSTLVDVSNMVLDIYACDIGQSSDIDEHFKRLKETIDTETKYMKLLLGVMGSLDTILTAATSNETSNDSTAPLDPSKSALDTQ